MRWLDWKTLLTTVAALLAGVGYAAGKGERMPPPPRVADWLADLPVAASHIEPHSPAREAIEEGKLEAAREMLSFRPFSEAPLPAGFPPFTPVGVIEVKEYPAYRKAVGPAFWTLFQHIQKLDIPMTAPVEMKDAASTSGKGEMAFLYQNTEVGERGEVDGVGVEDVPATTVVSLGCRGPLNKRVVDEAEQRLQAWIAEQQVYRAVDDSALRLYGYNSPMVPERDRYSEVQILLVPATP